MSNGPAFVFVHLPPYSLYWRLIRLFLELQSKYVNTMGWLDSIKPLTSDMENSSEKVCGKWYDIGSGSTRWLEVFAVVATGLLYFVFKCFKARTVFIITAVCFWIVFIYYRAHNDSSVVDKWGFRGKNFARCFLSATLLAAPILAAMAGFAASRGRLTFPTHAWILLALYPIWGIIQQFLARIFQESLAATTDMDVLPGVLECRPLRRTVQVRLGTNTLRLPGGTPIFVVSRQQFMKYPG